MLILFSIIFLAYLLIDSFERLVVIVYEKVALLKKKSSLEFLHNTLILLSVIGYVLKHTNIEFMYIKYNQLSAKRWDRKLENHRTWRSPGVTRSLYLICKVTKYNARYRNHF